MRRLHTLMKATGPQLEANTVPINSMIQNTFGGRARLSTSTLKLTAPMSRRVVRRRSGPRWLKRSLLTLKPTRDRKVDAEDSAAATMPASSSGAEERRHQVLRRPQHHRFRRLDIGLGEVDEAAGAVDQDLHADDREAGVDRARSTTCSLRAMRWRPDCQGLTA
jgi:hypothetical protein